MPFLYWFYIFDVKKDTAFYTEVLTFACLLYVRFCKKKEKRKMYFNLLGTFSYSAQCHFDRYFNVTVLWFMFHKHDMSPVKRICVFEHSVMTNFNCACPAIQREQGSDFLSEGSS